MEKKKSVRKMWRQGDVLVMSADRGAKAGEHIPGKDGAAATLALGEVTGHHHSIFDRGARLMAMEESRVTGESALQMIARLGGGIVPDRLLKLEDPAVLVHQEHDAIKLPAGDKVVRIQREYQPGAMRSVAD